MKKVIIFLALLLCLSSCGKKTFKYDTSNINVLKDVSEEFDFEIHSNEYMLVDITDFNILYAHNNDIRMYPASLTKILTLNTVLALEPDLDNTSYVTSEQVEYLIGEDASLAYIQKDYEYTLRDLLYALMLPSGADGALALENYFNSKGIDLVEQMNIRAEQLGCKDSHFMNSTGLHDENHYTTLNDLYLIVMDTLTFEEGRRILETLVYYTEDYIKFNSSLRAVRNIRTEVLGGKTGYTTESGQSIIVVFKHEGRSYLLFLGNAPGSHADGNYYHFDDSLKIFYELY